MYCVCGVEVIAGFVFVRWLSRRVAERVVLAIGLILCNISCVWCLIFLANPQGEFILFYCPLMSNLHQFNVKSLQYKDYMKVVGQNDDLWLKELCCPVFLLQVDSRGSQQSSLLEFSFRFWVSHLQLWLKFPSSLKSQQRRLKVGVQKTDSIIFTLIHNFL